MVRLLGMIHLDLLWSEAKLTLYHPCLLMFMTLVIVTHALEYEQDL